MGKEILAAASFQEQKYYIAPEFISLPADIKEEVRILCVLAAQKLFSTFVIGFLPDGDIYFEIRRPPNELDVDEIGDELEIKEIRREKKELLRALKLWYLVFYLKSKKEANTKKTSES